MKSTFNQFLYKVIVSLSVEINCLSVNIVCVGPTRRRNTHARARAPHTPNKIKVIVNHLICVNVTALFKGVTIENLVESNRPR